MSNLMLSIARFLSPKAFAAIFDGGGVDEGITAAGGIAGVQNGDPRVVVITIIQNILNYLALAAVITIIVAGIYMILGMGSDESRDTAKNIVKNTLIGLAIILFSRIIVGFILTLLTGE